MGDEKKGTSIVEMRNYIARLKNKADSMKEKGEEYAGELLATGVSAGAAFAGGLIDQYKGVEVAPGIKQFKIGTVPATLAAGLALEGMAAFGVFGQYRRVGYAGGQGLLASYSAVLGRQAGQALLDKENKTVTTTGEDVTNKKTGTDGK